MASKKHTLNYEFDLENKVVFISIPFDFFLKHKDADQGITIYPDRIEFIKEMIERFLLEDEDGKTPTS